MFFINLYKRIKRLEERLTFCMDELYDMKFPCDNENFNVVENGDFEFPLLPNIPSSPIIKVKTAKKAKKLKKTKKVKKTTKTTKTNKTNKK